MENRTEIPYHVVAVKTENKSGEAIRDVFIALGRFRS